MEPNNLNQLNNFIENYKVIGDLKKGEKLAVETKTGKLVISYGNTSGYGVKFLQGVSRSIGSMSGYYKTDFKDVMGKINEINDAFGNYIQYVKDHQEKLTQSQKKQITDLLNQAESSLKSMKDFTYVQSKDASSTINNQIKTIQELASHIQLIPLKEEPLEIKDDDDWNFVKETKDEVTEDDWNYVTENKPSENLALESFEVLYNEGKSFENSISSFIGQLENPQILKQKPTLNQKSEIKNDDEWVVVESQMKQGQQKIAQMQHPLFNQQQALKMLSEMNEFQTLSDSAEYWSKAVESLKDISKNHPDMSKDELIKIQTVVTHLVIAAFFPIVDSNGTTRPILSINKLYACLNEIAEDPKTFIGDRKWEIENLEKDQPIISKLHVLSLFNYSKNFANEIRQNDLFKAVTTSPNLRLFFLNSRTHVPQVYRQTCRGAVHNLLFQEQSGTIAELLTISQSVCNAISGKLSGMNENVKKAPAYKILYGSSLSKEDFVKKVIDESSKKLNDLKSRVLQLSTDKSCSPEKIAELTREWNFIMQDLETVLDPEHPRIYERQFLPDMYYASAVFNAVTTTVGQLLPGKPLAAERWESLDAHKLHEIGKEVFDLKERKYLYTDVVHRDVSGPSPKNADPLAIWKTISEHGGGILEFLMLGGNVGSSGHAIFVKSQISHGQPVIELFDPMNSTKKMYSPQNFLNFLAESYDVKKGKVQMTNKLWVY